MLKLENQTVGFDRDENALVIIDQTLLPNEEKTLYLKTKEEIFEAIKNLRLRGAPCIGVSMAIALAVLANDSKAETQEEFQKDFSENSEYLCSSRPTAVNLFWAAEEMKKVLFECKGETLDTTKSRLSDKACEILNDDIERCRKIGEYGAELLKNTDSVLTHCNAGRLACVKYGTALSPVYVAREQGHYISVYADETRPLLQGARLTAYELTKAGVDTTVICDNMASFVMSKGLVGAVLVGADRIAKNGDAANKIGTSAAAILAHYYNIPFYVCAPFSTVDKNTETGKDIKIELRDGDEIGSMWYQKKMIPDAASTFNPAFDVTPNNLITAFITEKGIIKPEEIKNYL